MNKKNEKMSFWDKITDVGTINVNHVDAVDGIRAFAVLIVLWFHYWQQSWLQGVFNLDNKLAMFGIEYFSETWIPATGYVFVDMMIIMTGFCLFLPYARNMVFGDNDLQSTGKFYVKRCARIMPSYYLCILVLGIFFVRVSDYGTGTGAVKKMLKDIFTHISFTQMFSTDTYISTKFNVALWTVCIELMFYLIFPLLAYFFKKKPILTYLGMMLGNYLYYVIVVKYMVGAGKTTLNMVINQFPAHLCNFANGMLAALLFVYLAKNLKHNKYTGFAATMVSIFSLYFIRIMLKYGLYQYSGERQFWQIQNRLAYSMLFTTFVLGTCFSFKWFRFLFANKVTKYLSAISFNLYIWHQYIACKLKEWKIPYWESENNMPQQDMGVEWQVKYSIIAFLVSVAVATIITYFFEKPVNNAILKAYGKITAKTKKSKSKRKG